MTTKTEVRPIAVWRKAGGHVSYQHPRVSVAFLKKDFDRINRFAEEKDVSFGSAVRQLCEAALSKMSN